MPGDMCVLFTTPMRDSPYLVDCIFLAYVVLERSNAGICIYLDIYKLMYSLCICLSLLMFFFNLYFFNSKQHAP